MSNENGSWIMQGLDWDDPLRIRSWRELISWINEVGFLPLFASDARGFSAEEHVSPLFWFTGDPEQDPWLWREAIAETGEVAYGKFFAGRAGFVSKEWYPYFANARREGYDFDAAWDDERVQRRYKAIMDLLEDGSEQPGFLLKDIAGFGKDGYRNFEGSMTWLQMHTYLVIRRFRCRVSGRGRPYGMPIAYYQKPEALWDYESVTNAYSEKPEKSAERILRRARERFPKADPGALKKLLGV